MTVLDIRRMTEAQVSLERLTRKCHQLCEESGQTYKQLKNLSGMQQVRRTLEYIMEDMKEETQLLAKMEECLEQTTAMFSACENLVAEHAEETRRNPQLLLFSETIIPSNIFRLLK